MKTALIATLFVTVSLAAQAPRQAPNDANARATVILSTNVYVAADPKSERTTVAEAGREVIVEERSGEWMKVFANTDEPDRGGEKPEFNDERTTPVSGWVRARVVVGPKTPDGDRILFGAAASYEVQAGRPRPPKGAAEAAALLYQRMSEYFPDSELGSEAEWRSVDLRWQLEKIDNASLPSAHEMDPSLRPRMNEEPLRKVVRFYRGTKWEALAAWDLLDAQVCGDWQGLPKCPEKESQLYERYAQQYADSPKAAEALWDAVYRQGVLVSMYAEDGDTKRVAFAAKHAHAISDDLRKRFPQSDFSARAATVIYKIEHEIPIYGSDRE